MEVLVVVAVVVEVFSCELEDSATALAPRHFSSPESNMMLITYLGIIDECLSVAAGNLQHKFQFLPKTVQIPEL
jgi:hypothetical protein